MEELALRKVNAQEGTLGSLSNTELKDRIDSKLGDLEKIGVAEDIQIGFKQGLKWVLNLIKLHD